LKNVKRIKIKIGGEVGPSADRLCVYGCSCLS